MTLTAKEKKTRHAAAQRRYRERLAAEGMREYTLMLRERELKKILALLKTLRGE